MRPRPIEGKSAHPDRRDGQLRPVRPAPKEKNRVKTPPARGTAYQAHVSVPGCGRRPLDPGLWMSTAYRAHATRPIRRKPGRPIGRKGTAHQAQDEPECSRTSMTYRPANCLTLTTIVNLLNETGLWITAPDEPGP